MLSRLEEEEEEEEDFFSSFLSEVEEEEDVVLLVAGARVSNGLVAGGGCRMPGTVGAWAMGAVVVGGGRDMDEPGCTMGWPGWGPM